MLSRAKFLVVPVLLACTAADTPPADTTAAVNTTAAQAPSVAGTWSVNVMPEDRDTTLLTYTLNATNETTGWRLTFPEREPLDVRVISMDGDNVVAEVGPYPSVLQSGVTVTTRTTTRLEGDRMVGTAIATYKVASGDSVVRLRLEGRR